MGVAQHVGLLHFTEQEGWPRPYSATWLCSNPIFKFGGSGDGLFMGRHRRGSERQQRREGKQPLDVATAALTADGDSYWGRAEDRRKQAETVLLVAAERLVLRGERFSLLPLSFSLSSTVPEGEGAPVVPGLVSCPSISQQLKHRCDRNGGCDHGEGRHTQVL